MGIGIHIPRRIAGLGYDQLQDSIKYGVSWADGTTIQL